MASGLENLLQEYLGQRINQSNQSEYTRLVLGGIPLTTLRDLFDLLTNGTGCEWEPTDGLRIPVFLVAREPGPVKRVLVKNATGTTQFRHAIRFPVS